MRARTFGAAALLVCLVAPASAEDGDAPPATIPRLVERAETVEGFAPAGWKLEAKSLGDLDRDGRPDAAFVLRGEDPALVVDGDMGRPLDTNPRIFGVAVADGAGFRLAIQNATLIPRKVQQNLDDAFEPENLAIVGGAAQISLRLFSSAGGWGMATATFTFRLDGARFLLIGFDRSDVQRNSGEMTEVSVNYLSGRMSRAKGSISDDELKPVWTKAPARRLTIEEVGDGLDFDPAPAKTRP